MKGNFDRNLNIFILICCVALGLTVAFFSTSIQARFFEELGVSWIAAFTIEPTLIIVSFLLGIVITKTHKTVAFIFLVILFVVSFISIVSMYSKKSFTLIEKNKITQNILSKSGKSEEIISNTIDKLSKRDNVSSKNIVKAIDQLQKQQDKATIKSEENVSELKGIIDVISMLLTIDEKRAILLFSVLIALSAVFAPSFLFYSAGMMVKKLNVVEEREDFSDLSLKQKIVMLAKDKFGGDVKKIAKFLETDEGTVKSQFTRIKNKES